MTSRAKRVIKVGGSLLDWPEFPTEFRRWLAAQSPAASVIVVGGGALVERVRALDRVHPMSDEAAHWLAIRAMSLTARVVAEWLSETKLVLSLADLQLAAPGAPQILDVAGFLRAERGTAGALPCDWNVTSDSIAAHVASVLAADELVLLKSASPPGETTHESAAQTGYVDARFAETARGLSVRCVNLRDRRFAEFPLAAQHAAI
jgi:5-(aminomethyl)-3-furanmethanol phosphate kinase